MSILWVIIHFAAACLLTALINWIGLIPWRRAVDAHWTERARLLKPVRFAANLNVFLVPFFINQLCTWCSPETFQMMIVYIAAGLFGSLLGGYPMDHEIYPQLDFRNWCHQIIAGWVMLFGFWIALVAACFLMPARAGWGMVLVTGGYLTFHLLVQCGLFLKYLRLVKFMRIADQRLRQIVDDLTARMNVKVRHTWQLDGTLANAFALPVTHELIFSNRLLEVCTDEEVAAICSHELAHLTESKTILAGRLLGSLSVVPFIFMNPSVQYFGMAGLFLPFVAMLLLMKFTRRLSQRMEKRADQMASSEQINEGVYARALEKVYRVNQAPAVNVNNKQTHPHLYDRMLAAGITPDYPRPARPRRLTLMGWLMVGGFGGVILFNLFRINS